MKNSKFKNQNSKIIGFSLFLGFFVMSFNSFVFAQETPPAPAAPRSVKIPRVQESTLPNGLKVVVVERKNVPLVTASLLVKSGANAENENLAGVADMTASLLLKGTKTRTATQIAEEMEFLGGNINSGANWNSSNVVVNVTSDKLDKALAIMSDVTLNPTFAQKEIDLYKSQALDELNVQLKQPSALASFAASRYSFGEHSAVGTPETIAKINQANILDFYRVAYVSNESVLIFTGDISQQTALMLANKFFGSWKRPISDAASGTKTTIGMNSSNIVNRVLVIDLPNSGQAAVTYAKKLDFGRLNENSNYYPSILANAVLGGGYSARLNEEIRIKRGLSYGAASGLSWRDSSSNFLARAQTKNVSAAEVAELMAAEIGKLTTDSVLQDELNPRKATLTGNFGRSLETTNGLAAQIGELYLYGIKPEALNSYMQNVQNVSDAQVKNFAAQNLNGGDIIIVGDTKVFMDDLRKRFPTQKIEIIPASELDLNSNTLRKTTSTIGLTKGK